MDVTPLAISGLFRLTPRRHGDARGHFCETWNAAAMAAVGARHPFVIHALSWNLEAGILRGLHYQEAPNAQGKLVRVARGRIRDVAVDARRGSPWYGCWVAQELSGADGASLWIPRGFLHGFVTLEPETEVVYMLDNVYAPDSAGSVRFDDPDLAIDWGGAAADFTLSDKDAAAGPFRALQPETPYEGHA